MTENYIIHNHSTKEEKYRQLLPQLRALVESETDLIANLANITAALKETFGWWWIGFYLIKSPALVLGPFQGPVACTRISYEKGVCGNAWKEQKSILVPDVDAFPGHIACSEKSVAEIVVPVFNVKNKIVAVMDIDSEKYDVLDELDVKYLEEISTICGKLF
jgi:L-methionine (R)-S-oxide reductase